MTSTRSLETKRVAVLAADGFEYVELSVPRAALRMAGASIDIISLHEGRIRGMNLTEPSRSIRVDRTLEAARDTDYDALLLPGGFISPDFLRQSELAREFVRRFDSASKPIATLCHGPWLLASAELVAGRRLAAWPGIRDDIVNAGGIWRNEPLVRDGNWVTSRGPQDLHEFVPAMLQLFAGGHAMAQAGNGSIEHVPSPKAHHPPRLALAAARVLPGPALPAFAGLALGTAIGALAVRSSSH